MLSASGRLFISSLGLMAVFTACTSTSTAVDPYATLTIDAAIQGQDRQIIGDYMLSLAPEDRDYVVFLAADGKLRSNRTSMEKVFGLFTSQRNNGVYTNAQGKSLTSLTLQSRPETFSSQAVTVTCGGTTGPYRRVYSQPGYSWQSANVYLPTSLSGEIYMNKSAGTGDTAFIYMGGWGNKGGAVDAGFQHGRYSGSATDDWAPIFLVENAVSGQPSLVTSNPDVNTSNGAPFRFKAGQEVFFKYYVTRETRNGATNTYVNLSAQGIPNFDATRRVTTFGTVVADKFEWNVNGTGNILKRMTTIGQTSQNLSSGSYVKNARWSNSTIGTSSTNAQTWSSAATGGYCSFPDPSTPQGQSTTAPNRKKIDVQYVSPAEETDSIYLQN